MNPTIVANAQLQTMVVGATLSAACAAVAFYLWNDNRSERWVLYWALSSVFNGLRYVVHIGTWPVPVQLGVDTIAYPAMMLLALVGSYELLPDKPVRMRTLLVAGAIAGAAYFAILVALGAPPQVGYFGFTLALSVCAYCMYRAYRVYGLSGYAMAAVMFLLQAVFIAVLLPMQGAEIVGNVVVPLVYKLASIISILLIYFQRAKLKLVEGDRILQAIFDTVATPIVITRAPEGRFEHVNRQAYRTLHLPPDAIGRTAQELGIVRNPEDRSRLYADLGRGQRIDGRVIDYLEPDGSIATLAVNAVPMQLSDGIRYVISFHDLTELRRAEADLRQTAEEMRQLYLRMATIEDDERRAVHRELHDRVGANLSALRLEIGLVAAALRRNDTGEIGRRLHSMREMTMDTIAMARDLMAELRPPALDDFGLVSALRMLAEQQGDRLGLPVDVEGHDLLRPLPPLIETQLFRIAQEALSNAARHAHASSVTISVEEAEDRVDLAVTDDGTGFPGGPPVDGRPHWGLRNMRERAHAVGSELRIETAPGTGTRVAISVARPREPLTA